ncbi:MAG: arsenate reductase (glutaredoxin) [Nitrospirota bacterium]|nr:arsenate reductase (glutaredoxin) [Nitrospirota bacterium]
MTDVVIYHNPKCSKSRQTLQLLRDQGIEPRVVEYLDAPLSAARLQGLLKLLGMASARQLMRTGEDEYRDLHLADAGKSEAELLAAMAAHPRLMERPVVVNGGRAALGRPPENVLGIL